MFSTGSSPNETEREPDWGNKRLFSYLSKKGRDESEAYVKNQMSGFIMENGRLE